MMGSRIWCMCAGGEERPANEKWTLIPVTGIYSGLPELPVINSHLMPLSYVNDTIIRTKSEEFKLFIWR